MKLSEERKNEIALAICKCCFAEALKSENSVGSIAALVKEIISDVEEDDTMMEILKNCGVSVEEFGAFFEDGIMAMKNEAVNA